VERDVIRNRSTTVQVAHVTTVDMTHRFLLMGQLRRLLDEGFRVTAVSAPGPWVAEIEAEGVRHVSWPHATRSWNLAADGRAFMELVRILRGGGYDIVHTHNPKPGVLGRVAARLAGVPVVVNTVHGFYATSEDPPIKREAVLAVERIAARFSDLELYQSEEDLRWARERGVVGRARGILLGNGTDLSRFDPRAVSPDQMGILRRELGLSDAGPIVGTVGRLVAEKGYRQLFEAAERLESEHPDVRFLVVGSPDPDKPDAVSEAEIRRAGHGNVVFAGWRADVRDLLGLMDLFVLPSWREGLPRSAIEAAAMGLPLVLTDIRGCREVARHGIEGFLVRPRDSQALAGEIATLLGDPGLRERMGRAARVRAVERFDERRVADKVVDAYRRLLRRKGRARAQPVDIRFRTALPDDSGAMARIHREALPDAFLPALGDRFLRRLYGALITDPESVALVAHDSSTVVGFAAGTASVRRFYGRFRRKHGVRAALAVGPRLLRPSVIRRVRETSRYPAGVDGTDAELLSIAVAPGKEGRGMGGPLARGVLRGLADLGADEVRVVVAASNEPANRFYRRLGFRHAGELSVHHGTPSNVWVFGGRSRSHARRDAG
jgi:glycosyltransferase involved in cell wall biosynthesis/ribosomal protein S18 acetylase RimI-like enzyme